MKMTESNCSETLMVGDLTEKAFGILANGKMFNILSSKIYTDKIAAPLRELACNAYDAHVAAGKKNVPFDVFIPTYDNPKFYIEDFGVGMDAQEIEELYSTYGESTKTDSNKFVGCLGLGSKSPFAYTDNFTVVSRKNGKQYFYTCMVEAGIPKLVKFNEEDTDLPSGVKIEFNVKTEDVWAFQSRAERIYRYFTPFPNFVNYRVNQGQKLEFEKDIARIDDGHYVLMGNVLYRYDESFFSDVEENGSMFRALRNIGTVLNARIGDVEIAVSREHLELKKKTIDFIVRKHTEYADHILKKFKETRSQYDSEFEYIRAYGKFLKENSFIDRTEYKNLIKAFNLPFEGEVDVVKVRQTSTSIERTTGKMNKAISVSEMEYTYEKRFIFVSEGRLQSSAGVNDWVQCGTNRNVQRMAILFNSESMKKALESDNIKIYSKKDFANRIVKVPNTESRPKNLQGLTRVYDYHAGTLGMKFVPATESTLDEIEKHDKVFYVKTSYGSVDTKHSEKLEKVFWGNFFYYMDQEKYFVIGVNKERFEEIKDNPKYVDFIEYMNKEFGVNSQNYKNAQVRFECKTILENIGILSFLNFKNFPEEFKDLQKLAKTSYDQLPKIENIDNLFRFYYMTDGEIIGRVKQITSWLQENYPMLTFAGLRNDKRWWQKYAKTEIRFIEEYIELVDSKNQKGE